MSVRPAQHPIDPEIGSRHQLLKVYTDGACMNNGKANARCGAGVWYGPNDAKNQAIRVPGYQQSNQIGDIAAIIVAARDAPLFNPLEIITDSKYAINGLTTHLLDWENQGWIKIKNADYFQKAAFLLRRRSAPTIFTWVKGHNRTQGNEESDRLAKQGEEKDHPDQLDLSIPDEFNIQGAKLKTLTQAIAYRSIMDSKPNPPRPSSAENIQIAQTALTTINGTQETAETVWLSLRKPVLRFRVQQLLYKAIHNAYLIGEKWLDIHDKEHRALCTTCHQINSIRHLLLECNSETRTTIWELARRTWPHGQASWPEIDLGTILGVGSICLPGSCPEPRGNARQHRNRELAKGKTRLLQTLISEASHLIWVLRCEKTIHEKHHTQEEVKKRWRQAIESKRTTDIITAAKTRRNKRDSRLMDVTWKKVKLDSDRPIPGAPHPTEVF
ncbi:ribonuclease H-like protein [Russula compacta]|nr:ribonuclease H-like protein [Russula compacta]